MAPAFGLLKPSCVLVSKNYLIGVSCLQFTRHFKSALKIKWVRPEPIPSIRPEMSGDLAPLGTIDTTQFPTPYKGSQELQSADDIVKRLHTLDFFHRNKLKEEYLLEYSNKVKAHKLDNSSPEVYIAKLTVKIRNLQIHIDNAPRDIVNKVRLKEYIDKRNKHLSRLRATDYKKFEWLLDRLDLEYKVYGFNAHERVERRRSLRRLTVLFIEKVKSERLAEYKSSLDSQKEGFLKDKLEKLIWIQKTEAECGAEPTIHEGDIEAVQNRLQELQIVKPKEVEE